MTTSPITRPSTPPTSEDQQASHSRHWPRQDLTADSYRRQVAQLLAMTDAEFGALPPETRPAQWIELRFHG